MPSPSELNFDPITADQSGKNHFNDKPMITADTKPNTRVTTFSSNEHDCNGVFPCDGINYGNQQGDYEGLVSYGGVSHPIWTDSRDQLAPSAGCSTGLAMEEVFSATVK